MRAEEQGLGFAALCFFITLVWLKDRGIPALRKAVYR
jgi:hypothetical protein